MTSRSGLVDRGRRLEALQCNYLSLSGGGYFSSAGVGHNTLEAVGTVAVVESEEVRRFLSWLGGVRVDLSECMGCGGVVEINGEGLAVNRHGGELQFH